MPMKGMILAAGFGSRLAPYTDKNPKPLFTILERPILDMTVDALADAGCTAVAVNAYHLSGMVKEHVLNTSYRVPVTVIEEKRILGTGGGIKNAADFFSDESDPFVVVNGDIVFNVDLRSVCDFHVREGCDATLVLHDYEEFNNVRVDSNGLIAGFSKDSEPGERLLAFTGIQILNPDFFKYVPETGFYSSIDSFREMIAASRKVAGMVLDNIYWRDIGSPEKYVEASYEAGLAGAFGKTGQHAVSSGEVEKTKLAGDGSDRKWYRVWADNKSMVLADHGISVGDSVCEAEAFTKIGRHLFQAGVRVPEIKAHDIMSGLVFVEDVGDEHLEGYVASEPGQTKTIELYMEIIAALVNMSINGARGFDPAWAWQTQVYDRELVIDKECRYFIESFVQGWMGLEKEFSDYKDEFEKIASNAAETGVTGLMHRDFQSRNIMINKKKDVYFIDFQGARTGPLQYDLASLLIDPYTALPRDTREKLLDYGAGLVEKSLGIKKEKFFQNYRYCAVARNLQALGAFGFLSKIKKKTWFEKYIPQGVKVLQENLVDLPAHEFSRLTKLANEISYELEGRNL